MSSAVAPPLEKPVLVFRKSGTGGEREVGRSEFFLEGEQTGFQDHLDDGSGAVGELDNAANVLANGLEVFFGCRT